MRPWLPWRNQPARLFVTRVVCCERRAACGQSLHMWRTSKGACCAPAFDTAIQAGRYEHALAEQQLCALLGCGVALRLAACFAPGDCAGVRQWAALSSMHRVVCCAGDTAAQRRLSEDVWRMCGGASDRSTVYLVLAVRAQCVAPRASSAAGRGGHRDESLDGRATSQGKARICTRNALNSVQYHNWSAQPPLQAHRPSAACASWHATAAKSHGSRKASGRPPASILFGASGRLR
jgi:hypothetical protein